MSDYFATHWTVARQAPLSMEFPRQEYWTELPFPSPGDLSDSEIKPAFPELQADSTAEPPGKQRGTLYMDKKDSLPRKQNKNEKNNLNRHLSKMHLQTANKHMKRGSVSLSIKERQIKSMIGPTTYTLERLKVNKQIRQL